MPVSRPAASRAVAAPPPAATSSPALYASDEAERQRWVQRVQGVVADLVEAREASLAQLAMRLEMPPRRLREHLAVAGIRFNDLVNAHRCELAKTLLGDPAMPIEGIVERMGFSEPSTFYRAFKRWVGEPPVAYRKRLLG